ncbi:hypothetical protein XENTR_v10021303 [Xenopus tropicalis]|nr:hypothetical protein XENTR_v10021303 [Xenopus tropicalis]
MPPVNYKLWIRSPKSVFLFTHSLIPFFICLLDSASNEGTGMISNWWLCCETVSHSYELHMPVNFPLQL